MKIKQIQLATMLNCSTQTIHNWYKWKERNPDNEYAQLLPEYTVEDRAFYWDDSDVYKFLEFKNAVMSRKVHIFKKEK